MPAVSRAEREEAELSLELVTKIDPGAASPG